MTDWEVESRTRAVGRKRRRVEQQDRRSNRFQRLEALSPSISVGSRRSSRESGEVSSSVDSVGLRSENANVRQSSSPQPLFIHSASDSKSASGSSTSAVSSTESGEINTDDELTDNDTSASDSDSDSASSSSGQDGETPDAMPSFTPINGWPQPPANEEDGLRLRDLSPSSQRSQTRYFGITSPDSLIYCLCCGCRGHTRANCPSRTCPHCHDRDAHAAHACPFWRKCSRCRQRGHMAPECTNPTFYGSDECDVCGLSGHVEEECVELWGKKPAPAHVRREGGVVKNCHRCGESGVQAHWGDDCPYRDRGERTDAERNLITLWSSRAGATGARGTSGREGLDYGSDRSGPTRQW